MSRFSEKGYYVKENAAVYFTKIWMIQLNGLKTSLAGTVTSWNGMNREGLLRSSFWNDS